VIATKRRRRGERNKKEWTPCSRKETMKAAPAGKVPGQKIKNFRGGGRPKKLSQRERGAL